GSRTTSSVNPSIFRARAQSVMRVTARSIWPFSAHVESYMGDLAGMRMYSVRTGMMSVSQARWTKLRVRSVSMVMTLTVLSAMRLSIRGKLVLLSLAILVVVSFSLTLVHLHITRAVVEDDMAERAVAFAREIAATIGDVRELESSVLMERQVRQILEVRPN